MLRAKEHVAIPSLSAIFTFGFAVESIEEFGGVSQNASMIKKKTL
jgi:hypothetical protein